MEGTKRAWRIRREYFRQSKLQNNFQNPNLLAQQNSVALLHGDLKVGRLRGGLVGSVLSAGPGASSEYTRRLNI